MIWLLSLLLGQLLGVMEVGPEVVAVVSHATQERLRTLIEKLSVMAEHRTVSLTVLYAERTFQSEASSRFFATGRNT